RVAASVPDCSTEIEAQIDLLSSPYGFCDVRFQLNQMDTPQIITEAGLAFVISPTLDLVGWLGDGPYPSYPGLDQLSMPGFFRLAPIDSFDPGNRKRVQALVFANDEGYGLGLLFWNGDISFQSVENGTLIQINASVAGKGSLGEATRFPVTENDLTHSDHWTTFRLVPFQPNAVPKFFQPWIKK
ncbi:hypothetical protein K8I31_06460, partial [bacterium]|nr:hypothetical protein [bacterium]